jgi:hypothetical protein
VVEEGGFKTAEWYLQPERRLMVNSIEQPPFTETSGTAYASSIAGFGCGDKSGVTNGWMRMPQAS